MNVKTYVFNLGKKAEISVLEKEFHKCPLSSASMVCAHEGNASIKIFENGEIRISVNESPESEKEILGIASLLEKVFRKLKIKINVLHELQSAEVISEPFTKTMIWHSSFSEFRKSLGKEISVKYFRYLIFKVFYTEFKERAFSLIEKGVQEIGYDLFKENASKINDLDSAFNVLKEFFKAEKLGLLEKIYSEKENEKFRIELMQSLSSSGLFEVGMPLAFFEKGIIKAFFTSFYGKEINVKEAEGWGTGSHEEIFIVSL